MLNVAHGKEEHKEPNTHDTADQSNETIKQKQLGPVGLLRMFAPPYQVELRMIIVRVTVKLPVTRSWHRTEKRQKRKTKEEIFGLYFSNAFRHTKTLTQTTYTTQQTNHLINQSINQQHPWEKSLFYLDKSKSFFQQS